MANRQDLGLGGDAEGAGPVAVTVGGDESGHGGTMPVDVGPPIRQVALSVGEVVAG